MNIFQRALSYFSPQQRLPPPPRKIQLSKRSNFLGDDFSSDFAFSNLSPDAALQMELVSNRSKVRVLERKNDYKRKFLNDCEKNILGEHGICLQRIVFGPDG